MPFADWGSGLVWFGSSKDLKLGLFLTGVAWFLTFVKNLQFY
jgi:hypothetical protein